MVEFINSQLVLNSVFLRVPGSACRPPPSQSRRSFGLGVVLRILFDVAVDETSPFHWTIALACGCCSLLFAYIWAYGATLAGWICMALFMVSVLHLISGATRYASRLWGMPCFPRRD